MRNMLVDLQKLEPRSIKFIAMFGTGTSIALYFILPWLLSLFVAPPASDYAPQKTITDDISYGETPPFPCQPVLLGRDARYMLVFNQKIKVHESPRMIFQILLSKDQLAMCTSDSVTIKPIRLYAALNSSAFEISPVGNIEKVDSLTWIWTLTPKKAGKHAIQLVVEKSNDFEPDLSLLHSSLNLAQQSQNEIGFDIDVRTELGLTSKQEAVFKLVGVIIGLFGTILGYPFFKTAFENKKTQVKKQKRKPKK